METFDFLLMKKKQKNANYEGLLLGIQPLSVRKYIRF
jgi:hypothetical protein